MQQFYNRVEAPVVDSNCRNYILFLAAKAGVQALNPRQHCIPTLAGTKAIPCFIGLGLAFKYLMTRSHWPNCR